MRRLLVLSALVAGLVLAGLAPASAKPGRVGAPWVTASGPTSITLTWPAAKGATRYRVTYGASVAAVKRSTAPARWTKGRQTSLRVGGLSPGRTYCFMVSGRKGSSAGARSSVHCKPTMRRANDSTRPRTSVATFNVCLLSSTCTDSPARLEAILDRIRRADADVLVLQELQGPYGRQLQERLEAEGYVLGVLYSEYQAIYYRPERWDLGSFRYTACEPDGRCYEASRTIRDQAWLGATRGQGRMVMVGLEHRETGTVHRFYGVHLSAGGTDSARRLRRLETDRLVEKMRSHAEYSSPQRVVVAGDWNTYRGRTDDYPRVALARVGLHDAYERSSTYAFPYRDSYTANRTVPRRGVLYGDHVDRVFLHDAVGSTDWRVVVRTRNGRYTTPMASDHNPVRVSLYLP
ncbi:endonuclease/exonuclease/phosphatase family protein [Aeromicrobium sp.]|jgi:endonuclease/exonuclease/phosphatase family metal-dependent hydrolase|uniref:endonuclease/exonuclease/phosphatase family protein n=1 Tax=Aeromicrobium sp. TaxID=1871063 RepID=UPI004033E5B4